MRYKHYDGIPIGTDEFGFVALPGGYVYSGYFNYVGDECLWWSATEYNAGYAYSRYMGYNDERVSRYNDSKTNLYSVRCVRD